MNQQAAIEVARTFVGEAEAHVHSEPKQLELTIAQALVASVPDLKAWGVLPLSRITTQTPLEASEDEDEDDDDWLILGLGPDGSLFEIRVGSREERKSTVFTYRHPTGEWDVIGIADLEEMDGRRNRTMTRGYTFRTGDGPTLYAFYTQVPVGDRPPGPAESFAREMAEAGGWPGIANIPESIAE